MLFQWWKQIFLSSEASYSVLGPIHPPIHWVAKAFPRRQVTKVITTDDFGNVDKQY